MAVHTCLSQNGNLNLWSFALQFEDEEIEEDVPLERRKKIFTKECESLLRGFAPNKLLTLPTARIQNKCKRRLAWLALMKSL